MKGLNLDGFKKIKEDNRSATMIHKDGHQIIVAKSALKPIQIKQLEKLPIHMESGGVAGAMDAMGIDQNAGVRSDVVPDYSSAAAPGLTDQIGRALVANQQAGINPFPVPGIPASSNNENLAANTGGDLAMANGPDASAGQSVAMPAAQQQSNSGLPDTNAGLQAQINANNRMAAAQGEQGKQTAAQYDKLDEQLAQLPTTEQIQSKHAADDKSFMDYLKTHDVDPNHFWADKGTGQKISAGIGLFLGGIGSAFTGQANPALGIINKAIENDIDAQKSAMGKNKTLWSMNREGLKDDLAANFATRNQAYVNLQNQIQKIAAQNTSPIAQARAQQLNAVIENEKAMNNFRRSLISGPTADNADPSARVNFLVPEAHKKDAFAKIDAAKYTVQNVGKIMDAYDKASSANHVKDYVPGQHNADIDALHTLLGPTIPALEGSARQGLMDALYSGTTPNPISDSAAAKATKRQALQDYLSSKGGQDSVLNGNGIHLDKFPSTNVRGAVDALNKPVQGADGRLYQRQGNFMVPVSK